MSVEFQILPAQEENIEELVALVNSAYRGEEAKVGWTTEAYVLDGQRIDSKGMGNLIDPPRSIILTIRAQGESPILGCVNLQKRKNNCYLGMLTVSPLLQNQKIGQRLLVAAEEMALKWQCVSIIMQVLSVRQELIAWYQRKGFKLTGERKPFPYGQPQFGIPRVEGLEFVFLEKELFK